MEIFYIYAYIEENKSFRKKVTEMKKSEKNNDTTEDAFLNVDVNDRFSDDNSSTDGVGPDHELMCDTTQGSNPDVHIHNKIENNNLAAAKEACADRAFGALKNYCSKKWHANKEDPEHRLFELCFSMMFTSLKVIVRIEAKTETISIITILPITRLKEYRIIMGRHFNELEVPFGSFHLDENGGEISHRFTYICSEEGFDSDVFEKYLDNCLIAADMNYVSIAKTATGSLTTKERIKWNHDIKQLAYAINE